MCVCDRRDTEAITEILSQLTRRIHAVLPSACTGLADDAGKTLTILLREYNSALTTMQSKITLSEFRLCLQVIANNATGSQEPRGCATRLLSDAGELSQADTLTLFSFAVSTGNDPADVALWLDGFLANSGAVLVHDTTLLALIDSWLKTLSNEKFVTTLPMLRRTFGAFSTPERSQIGQAVQSLNVAKNTLATDTNDVVTGSSGLDTTRALPALKTVTHLFNLPPPQAQEQEQEQDS